MFCKESINLFGERAIFCWQFRCDLRSILVRTILRPIHTATCTRPWRASSKIAWVLYQLGTPLNARKSTSAMSEQIILLNKPEKAITTTTQSIVLVPIDQSKLLLHPYFVSWVLFLIMNLYISWVLLPWLYRVIQG